MNTHTETVLPAARPTPPSDTGQRLILRGISWATYERLLADFQDSHAAHFAYDRGELEIMVLSFEHETLKHIIATLVELLAGEMEIDVEGGGSTTFRREDLAKGFEPDACFYIRHAERVRGKKQINLTEDPSPDLVIEIDITSPSLNKLPIYAAVGVPEIWRYDGQELTIFQLEGGGYREQTESTALPGVTSAQLSRFIEESQELRRPAWLRHVREWARRRGD
jgi:Uma2 family endonuclease